MSFRKLLSVVAVASAALAVAPSDAEAGIYEEVVRAGNIVGFDEFRGTNPLTQGTEYLLTNTFRGNAIDLGAWTLTLQGPLSVGFSSASRPYNSLELTFGTAASGSANTSTFDYSLDYELGETTASVSGSLLVDGGVRVDQLGFYNVNLDVSSRQTLTNGGNFGGQTNQYDLDLGPVNVRGNVFIDAVILLTQPLFDAADADNPFAQLSGVTRLQEIVETQTSDLMNLLQAGRLPGDTTAERGITVLTPRSDRYGPLNEAGELAFDGAVVPEPTVMLLMLVGLPFVLRRRSLRV